MLRFLALTTSLIGGAYADAIDDGISQFINCTQLLHPSLDMYVLDGHSLAILPSNISTKLIGNYTRMLEQCLLTINAVHAELYISWDTYVLVTDDDEASLILRCISGSTLNGSSAAVNNRSETIVGLRKRSKVVYSAIEVRGWTAKGCPGSGEDYDEVTAAQDCHNFASTGYMTSVQLNNYSKCYPAGMRIYPHHNCDGRDNYVTVNAITSGDSDCVNRNSYSWEQAPYIDYLNRVCKNT